MIFWAIMLSAFFYGARKGYREWQASTVVVPNHRVPPPPRWKN